MTTHTNHGLVASKAWKVAINFFAKAKKGGMKWYGIVPYHFHLKDVGTVFVTLFPELGDEGLALAYLHDNVEEGQKDLRDLGFSEAVVVGVEALAIDLDNKETSAGGYEAIRNHGALAMAVKLADRLANCTRCLVGWTVSLDHLDPEKIVTDFIERIRGSDSTEAARCGANADYLAGYESSYTRFRQELFDASKILGDNHGKIWAMLDYVHHPDLRGS